MKKLSIKLKVTLWYTLFMIIISAIVLCIMQSVGRRMLMRDVTARLIDSVNKNAHFGGGPMRDMRDIPDFRFFNNGIHTAVCDGDGNTVNGFIPFEFADEIELKDNDLQKKTYDGKKYMTYVRKSDGKDGEELWVKGVVSVTDESRMLTSMTNANLVLCFILILAASVGGYFIIKRSFAPVDKISRTAKRISESTDLSERIDLGNGNDEIYSLAKTFDEMLDKIEKTLENEKQFTSDASHELRTPVAVITAECEYIEDCAKNLDEAKESVASIKRQSDKMSALISELLTISRMDRNTQQVNLEKTDISELVSVVCDEQREIHGNDITLTESIKPNVYAMADHFLFASLFINLISNAYCYGKPGGTVKVNLDENDASVIFSVEDDGIGISEENLPKIWERFYRADKARGNENGNMGLGLSMVKWIANRHNGTVSVKSKLGEGSKFTFVFPKNL